MTPPLSAAEIAGSWAGFAARKAPVPSGTMSWRFSVALAFALMAGSAFADDAKAPPTDAQIRKVLIEESRAGYSGNCPCPYDLDRAGRRCGKRSAYSRPGGAAPLCFESDVTNAMVEEYRSKRRGE